MSKWIRTRRCGCGKCRFHSPKEPGWELCPDNEKPDYDQKAAWLWRRDYSGEEKQA